LGLEIGADALKSGPVLKKWEIKVMTAHPSEPQSTPGEVHPDAAQPAAAPTDTSKADPLARDASASHSDVASAPQGAQARVDMADASLPSDAAALIEAQARASEYHDAFLRAKAEMENIRRRAQEDVAKTHKYAVENFAEGLVPVIDSLEAALATSAATAEQLRAGAEITLRQLVSAFEKARLLPIDPKGERFDPNRHQAISMLPSTEVPAQHVIAVLQKGWTIGDRILRPALVTVSNGAGASVPSGA
jgi:molecular chaperone GrpE